MTAAAVWHGTTSEGQALIEAVRHNCTCPIGGTAAQDSCCPAHELLKDQQTLDRLIFARRIAACIRREEFTSDAYCPTPDGAGAEGVVRR